MLIEINYVTSQYFSLYYFKTITIKTVHVEIQMGVIYYSMIEIKQIQRKEAYTHYFFKTE